MKKILSLLLALTMLAAALAGCSAAAANEGSSNSTAGKE